jgi:hypothetical protein
VTGEPAYLDPTRLEPLAFDVDMTPGELRDWLRREIRRREGLTSAAVEIPAAESVSLTSAEPTPIAG